MEEKPSIPAADLDPEAQALLRTIISETEMCKTLVAKSEQPREEVIESVVRLIEHGYATLIMDRAGGYRLEPTAQGASHFLGIKPTRRRRRAFRP
jgi:hypothetical protein